MNEVVEFPQAIELGLKNCSRQLYLDVMGQRDPGSHVFIRYTQGITLVFKLGPIAPHAHFGASNYEGLRYGTGKPGAPDVFLLLF